jgi:hypothetical protein
MRRVDVMLGVWWFYLIVLYAFIMLLVFLRGKILPKPCFAQLNQSRIEQALP